jgi:hypothetical protein
LASRETVEPETRALRELLKAALAIARRIPGSSLAAWCLQMALDDEDARAAQVMPEASDRRVPAK